MTAKKPPGLPSNQAWITLAVFGTMTSFGHLNGVLPEIAGINWWGPSTISCF